MSPLVFGFLPDDLKDFRFGNRETHIIPDAEQHGPRTAPLFDDKGPSLILYPAKELAEICPQIQRTNDYAVAHKLSSSDD
jgi:hypothetical protein